MILTINMVRCKVVTTDCGLILYEDCMVLRTLCVYNMT